MTKKAQKRQINVKKRHKLHRCNQEEDMSKAFETAQQLAEALDFVIDFCESQMVIVRIVYSDTRISVVFQAIRTNGILTR